MTDAEMYIFLAFFLGYPIAIALVSGFFIKLFEWIKVCKKPKKKLPPYLRRYY